MAHNRELSQFANAVGYNGGNIGIGTDNPDSNAQATIYKTGGNTPLYLKTDNANSYLYFQDSGTSTFKCAVGSSSNTLKFVTDGSERLRITGDGPHLLLGGTADVNEITESASNTGMVIGSTSVGNGGIAIINSTSGTGRIYFGDATHNNAARNRGQINYYHNGDYMMFATAGDERLRIHSDGHGEFSSGAITRVLVADDHTPTGTSQPYTGIPAWATKITIIFDRISMTGGSEFIVQLGTSGGTITSNYVSSSQSGSAGTTENSTAGFVIFNNSSNHTHTGSMVIEKLGTSNKWITNHSLSIATGARRSGNGVLTSYSGTIDRVVLTTEGGSNTFDNGAFTVYAEA